jgi:hypothetical protein
MYSIKGRLKKLRGGKGGGGGITKESCLFAFLWTALSLNYTKIYNVDYLA